MDCGSSFLLFLVAVGFAVWIGRVSRSARQTQQKLQEVEAEVVELQLALRRQAEAAAPVPAPAEAAPSPTAEEPAVARAEEPVPLETRDEESVTLTSLMDERPVDEAPVDERPVEEALADEAAADGRPVDEASLDERPVDERPADEAPIDERPPIEPPVEEPPQEDAGAADFDPPVISVDPTPPRRIDWERWIGVRGAAVLGAAVLALAGLLFLKFSIERGLISPTMRVIFAGLAGVGALLGSESLRRRSYRTTANAVAGAGVVLLYGAVWAARSLYGLIPDLVAFPAMAAITVLCGTLAWHYSSRIVAGLGLIGGFSTPLLLSSGVDHPITLFGYLLLLNIGLLWLAARHGWSILALLSLLFTAFYEASWVFDRMDSQGTFLGLLVVALFAGVYAASSRAGDPEKQGQSWRLMQVGGVLLPFAFAIHIASEMDPRYGLYPTVGLLAFLSLLALWLGEGWRRSFPGMASAAASVGVIASWSLSNTITTPRAWEIVICALGLAAVFRGFFELLAERSPRQRAATLAASGFLVFLVLLSFAYDQVDFWPWLVGWLGLAALLWWSTRSPDEQHDAGLQRRSLVALGLSLAFGGYATEHDGSWQVFLAALAVALIMQWRLSRETTPETQMKPWIAGAFLPLAMLAASNMTSAPELRTAAFGILLLAFGGLVARAASALGSGGWYLTAVVASGIALNTWSDNVDPEIGLGVLTASVLIFTAWPFFAEGLWPRLWAWRGAALAGPIAFPAVHSLFESRFGDGAIGVVPLTLAAIAAGAFWRAQKSWSLDTPPGKSRLVWFAATALGFISLAVPMQLEKEWITVGWALQGVALIYLWRRVDHAGLKFFGLALLAVVTLRLVANPAVTGYYPRGGWPILNWLLYTYWVPAAALIAAFVALRPLEPSRYSSLEKRLFGQRAAGAIACGLAAIVVIFVWINLAVSDYYSSGRFIEQNFDRLPARDLTRSLSWVGYALSLLGLGMWRNSKGLRWISLGFLVLSIAKVFLWDLGELEDLYRVASLVGLAFSLLLVSVAYQRFVFRSRRDEELDGTKS